MFGGGSLGWAWGEFTDDTQLALLVASSLIEREGLCNRFRTWLAADPSGEDLLRLRDASVHPQG